MTMPRTIRLRPIDSVLLLLAVNKGQPIDGTPKIHYLLFIYEILDIDFEPGLLGPYSKSIEEAILELQRRGLIKVLKEKGYRRYVLTQRGVEEAKRLIEKLRNSYVEMRNSLIMKGDEVIRDLKILKKKAGEKSIPYLLYKCISKARKEWPINFAYKPSPAYMAFLHEVGNKVEDLLRKHG
ncbi:MAG: hypothetical protein DRO04_01655 [Candidatus Iainarchaeum archaeon]|uniref:Uncharacterized protein n=1 Tax=Candidatus Iainarchaeum sp. TaxID=3101447 RepID=A0A497JHB2_9ARCH|nr:MAG: hypothetical protein DRO04_01655 [Candidatus Diapherotrites archaeon]